MYYYKTKIISFALCFSLCFFSSSSFVCIIFNAISIVCYPPYQSFTTRRHVTVPYLSYRCALFLFSSSAVTFSGWFSYFWCNFIHFMIICIIRQQQHNIKWQRTIFLFRSFTANGSCVEETKKTIFALQTYLIHSGCWMMEMMMMINNYIDRLYNNCVVLWK